MTLEQAFEIILIMARAEYNKAPCMEYSKALELVTAFHYTNVKGN